MTILYKTKYLDFKMSKSPSNADWFYVKRTNDSNKHDSAVVITTLVKKTDGYNFLFLKTLRPPIYIENKAKYCLESPAGLIGDINKHEMLLECAKKELLEETGYIADNLFIETTNSSTSAGLSSETLSFVTAVVDNDLVLKEPIDDGGIIKERFFVSLNNVHKYLLSLNTSEISIACATICGIYFALQRFN